MDTATKAVIDAAKLLLKEQFKNLQKQQVIRLEIKWPKKLLQQVNQKKKKKQRKQKKFTFHQKKDNKLLMKTILSIKFNFLCIKMDFQKVENLFDSASEFTKICYQKMD